MIADVPIVANTPDRHVRRASPEWVSQSVSRWPVPLLAKGVDRPGSPVVISVLSPHGFAG